MDNLSVYRALYTIKTVFGFDKAQVAKITGTSRMLLTLQERKNVVSPKLQDLYNQSVEAKKKYGTDLAKHHSNVLVRKKTLKQHFMEKTKDIETVLDEAHARSKNIKVVRVKRDAMHMYLRTARLRRGG